MPTTRKSSTQFVFLLVLLALIALTAGSRVVPSALASTILVSASGEEYTHTLLLPAVFTYSPSFTQTQVSLSGMRVTDVLFDPRQSSQGFATAPLSSLYQTADGGQTWIAVPGGPPTGIDVAMHPLTSSLLYVASASSGIWQSADGGANWNLLSGPPFAFMLSMAVHPITPTTLFAGSGPWEFSGGWIFRSTDAGQTWSAVSEQNRDIDVFAFHPITTTKVYAGSRRGYGVLRSTDAGATWITAASGLPLGAPVTDLLVLQAPPYQLFAATSAGLYTSDNDGETWNATWPGIHATALAVNPDSSHTLYLGTTSGIFVSYNLGASWYPLGPCAADMTVNRLVFAGSSPVSLWAATEGGLWECQQP